MSLILHDADKKWIGAMVLAQEAVLKAGE